MVTARFVSPKEFEVNEAWIVVRATAQSFYVGPMLCDCYVLMDAGSAYVFGHVLVSKDSKPDEDEVEQLLHDAWGLKRRWARRLIVTEECPTTSVFVAKVEDHGLSTENMPTSSLLPIIGPMKDAFAELVLNQDE